MKCQEKYKEQAECEKLPRLLSLLGEDLDRFLQFNYPDAMHNAQDWAAKLGGLLPEFGIGVEQVVAEMGQYLIPSGSQVVRPGCSSYITTGATSVGAVASLACSVAAPQRFGITGFNYLEEVSLDWMAQMFELPDDMKGVYSSCGSTANLVALGAARQYAFEKIDINVSLEGLHKPCRLYGSVASHRSIHRSAGVLGMGRSSVVTIASDSDGRMSPKAFRKQLQKDVKTDTVPVAIIANAGSTDTGVIDPLLELGQIAQEFGIWFHIDGAYGLPGILDPEVKHLYAGLEQADSVIVDAHKWLGAPVGIGATYVRDRALLERAFTQDKAAYLDSSLSESTVTNSMDSFGIPYHDYGVELSAPPRGAIVWALIREIGKLGLSNRIRRHNGMARRIADRVRTHPELELLQEPVLSICCFRFVNARFDDLNELNRRIHRRLVHNGVNIPSTTMINDTLVIRPCFIGARASWQQADDLVDEVIHIGNQLVTDSAYR